MIEGNSENERVPSKLTLVDERSSNEYELDLQVLGWREWIVLPSLGEYKAKAKVDTGARTSALHARNLRIEETSAGVNASFSLGNGDDEVEASARVVEQRLIRSSNGQDELRPVILTPIIVLGHTWHAEVTLSDRELMGFPMLLGRSAIRNRFLVDPNRSFSGGI